MNKQKIRFGTEKNWGCPPWGRFFRFIWEKRNGEKMFQILLPKNFRWSRWGDERRIKRAQPWERGPPYFCIIIYSYLLSALCVQRRSLFPRKMMVRYENYSYITIVNNFQIKIFRPPLINFNWQTPPIANSLSELSRLP
jgi:hypothetical protein